MKTYLVGGAVRDKLLKLPISERDWVVVGATPQEMLDLGFTPVGKDFPVFLHPETKEEYALARTERKTSPGYKGFAFHATPDVTLEQDLQRRDLTINAIAEDEDGTLIDPCGGQDDLQTGMLRHISPAFAEDPVRILRVARLAARFDAFGFRVAHGTNSLMWKMVRDGEVNHLVPERVWAELFKALKTDNPQRFFTVLRGCGALPVLFPEIDHEYAENDGSHGTNATIAALAALKQASHVSDDPQVRFAVLMQALGHDFSREHRIQQVRALCERLRTPKDFTNLAIAVIQYATDITDNEPEKIIQLMENNGAFKQNSRWLRLLETCEAAQLMTRNESEQFAVLAKRAATINAAQLSNTGLSGRELGDAIRERRKDIIQDALASHK
jgi:tRNA nucleotidyltransferase (CCA-adding enzyme)